MTNFSFGVSQVAQQSVAVRAEMRRGATQRRRGFAQSRDGADQREAGDLLQQLAAGQQAAIAAGNIKTIDVAGSRLINKSEAQDV